MTHDEIIRRIKKYNYKNHSIREVDRKAIEKALFLKEAEILEIINGFQDKEKSRAKKSVYWKFEELKQKIKNENT